MSVTVPFRLHRHAPVTDDSAAPAPERSRQARSSPDGPVPPRPPRPAASSAARTAAPRRAPTVQLGSIDLRSAALYLFVWAVVLFVVEVLVFWMAHAALSRLGVLESVSRAAAAVLDQEVPASGVLPAFEVDALLPKALVVAGALAVLWLLTTWSLVLVHNCICALTGGPRVQVR